MAKKKKTTRVKAKKKKKRIKAKQQKPKAQRKKPEQKKPRPTPKPKQKKPRPIPRPKQKKPEQKKPKPKQKKHTQRLAMRDGSAPVVEVEVVGPFAVHGWPLKGPAKQWGIVLRRNGKLVPVWRRGGWHHFPKKRMAVEVARQLAKNSLWTRKDVEDYRQVRNQELEDLINDTHEITRAVYEKEYPTK